MKELSQEFYNKGDEISSLDSFLISLVLFNEKVKLDSMSYQNILDKKILFEDEAFYLKYKNSENLKEKNTHKNFINHMQP